MRSAAGCSLLKILNLLGSCAEYRWLKSFENLVTTKHELKEKMVNVIAPLRSVAISSCVGPVVKLASCSFYSTVLFGHMVHSNLV